MSAHTPTPWKLYPYTQHKGQFAFEVVDPVTGFRQDIGQTFDVIDGDPKANAELIVRAVNSHKELVKALQQIAAPLDCGCVPCRGQCRSQIALECEVEGRQDIAREALAKLEGRS